MQFARMLLTSLAFPIAALAATDAFVGTWKVNIEKSKTSSGRSPQASSLTFEATPDGYRIVSTALQTPMNVRFNKEYAVPNQGIAMNTLTVLNGGFSVACGHDPVPRLVTERPGL